MSSAEMESAMQTAYEQFNISHSIYGTMGGYLTYCEVVNKLDSIETGISWTYLSKIFNRKHS
ncbi:MAG: hypothetical protein R2942_00945 [Ignavibacteria bacterium]